MKRRKVAIRSRKTRRFNRANRKLVVTLATIATIALAGLIAWKTVPQHAIPIGINEVTSTDTVTFSLSPSMVNAAPGQEVPVNVSMSTGGAKVTAVTLEITYNPAELSVSSIGNGTLLTTVLVPGKVSAGTATLTVASPPQSGGVDTNGVVATLKVKPLKSGQFGLSFGTGTMAAAIGSTGNVFSSGSPATINAVTTAGTTTTQPPVIPQATATPTNTSTSVAPPPAVVHTTATNPAPVTTTPRATTTQTQTTTSVIPPQTGTLPDGTTTAPAPQANIFMQVYLGWKTIVTRIISLVVH